MSQILNILTYIAMIGICAASFYIIWKLFIKAYDKRNAVFNRINKAYSNAGTMDYKKLFLSRRGIMYRMKNYEMTPAYYLILRICIGFLGSALLFLLSGNMLATVIGFPLGFFGVSAYFRYEDKKDNQDILMDIYNTYSNIKIQMSAGIYIRQCLEYTYDMVVNERYKEALKELIQNFSDKTVSSSDAVLIFKNRFHCSEIDKLSALLSSFMQYGMNANHADDIMTEIQGIIQAETLKAEHDIETRTGVINFAFFGIIIVMVIYSIFTAFSLGGII